MPYSTIYLAPVRYVAADVLKRGIDDSGAYGYVFWRMDAYTILKGLGPKSSIKFCEQLSSYVFYLDRDEWLDQDDFERDLVTELIDSGFATEYIERLRNNVLDDDWLRGLAVCTESVCEETLTRLDIN